MDDYRRHWGERIKAARKAHGWTQADLAREVGISHQMVASIEQAKRVPSDTLRIRLAAALDVDVHDLFSYEQEPAVSGISELRGLVAGGSPARARPSLDHPASHPAVVPPSAAGTGGRTC